MKEGICGRLPGRFCSVALRGRDNYKILERRGSKQSPVGRTGSGQSLAQEVSMASRSGKHIQEGLTVAQLGGSVG